MRSKEDSAEYRYFPDPDLLPVHISDEMMKEATNIPELPSAKLKRYVEKLEIKESDAKVIIDDYAMAVYFEDLISKGHDPKLCVTWLTVELLGRLKNGLTIETSPVNSLRMSELLKRIEDNTISQKAAKDVLDNMMENNAKVDDIIDKLGLKQISDDASILAVIDEVLSKNGDKVAEYKSGKDKLFGFFVGQVMKAGKGAFNPAKVNELLKAKL